MHTNLSWNTCVNATLDSVCIYDAPFYWFGILLFSGPIYIISLVSNVLAITVIWSLQSLTGSLRIVLTLTSGCFILADLSYCINDFGISYKNMYGLYDPFPKWECSIVQGCGAVAPTFALYLALVLGIDRYVSTKKRCDNSEILISTWFGIGFAFVTSVAMYVGSNWHKFNSYECTCYCTSLDSSWAAFLIIFGYVGVFQMMEALLFSQIKTINKRQLEEFSLLSRRHSLNARCAQKLRLKSAIAMFRTTMVAVGGNLLTILVLGIFKALNDLSVLTDVPGEMVAQLCKHMIPPFYHCMHVLALYISIDSFKSGLKSKILGKHMKESNTIDALKITTVDAKMDVTSTMIMIEQMWKKNGLMLQN